MNYNEILNYFIVKDNYSGNLKNILALLEEESFNHVISFTLEKFDISSFANMTDTDDIHFSLFINEFIDNLESNPLNAASKGLNVFNTDINKLLILNMKLLVDDIDFLFLWDSFFRKIKKINKANSILVE